MASQIGGKTEMCNNLLGYHMDHEPTNCVVMYPTIEATERYSKRKFAPMARDSPALAKLLSPARSRDSGNTITVKEFLGGSVYFVGAASPSSLRQSSGEVLIADEIDAMDDGDEGDPVELLWKRAESYDEAIKVVASTPTRSGSSRIQDWFDKSDQQYWFVPCAKCKHYQTLRWSQVQWPKGEPKKARIICEKCGDKWTDRQRLDAYYAGRWQPTAKFTGIRGYHLNGIYCPWPAHRGFENRLHEMAAEHLRIEAKAPEKRRVWVNTFLCETYEEEAERPPDPNQIQTRAESYGDNHQLPAGVLVLTCGVDVQSDRLEAEIRGWGMDEESWGIEMGRFLGNPELPEPWNQLADWLAQKFDHPHGHVLTIRACCVDSGHKPKPVYAFCRRMYPLAFPVKGSSTPEAPLRSMPRKTTVTGVRLIMVGTNTAKDHLFSRLHLDKPGPRFMHFPIGHGYDEEYFAQLCAEKRHVRYLKGRQIHEYVKVRERNEAIDLSVYNMVALDLLNVNWEATAKRLAKQQNPKDKESRSGSAVAPPRTGFVSRWRR